MKLKPSFLPGQLSNIQTKVTEEPTTPPQFNKATMLYVNFIGRIGKDAKVISGTKGKFLSMDIAVSDYFKGEETTTWVRVRSNRHTNMGKYLTKGRLVLIEGTLSQPTIWASKDGQKHVQLSIVADNIQFVSAGKKKENVTPEPVKEVTYSGTEKDDDPLGAIGPEDSKGNVPF
jgi:single-strand DNA-binding protein